MKKQKALRINLKEDTLKTVVTVLIGSEEEIINTFDEWMADQKERDEIRKIVNDGGTEAQYIEITNSKNEICCILWFKKQWFNNATLIHEMFHYTHAVMRLKGIVFSKDSEEVFAYFLDKTCRDFFDKYDKLKKKEDQNG